MNNQTYLYVRTLKWKDGQTRENPQLKQFDEPEKARQHAHTLFESDSLYSVETVELFHYDGGGFRFRGRYSS